MIWQYVDANDISTHLRQSVLLDRRDLVSSGIAKRQAASVDLKTIVDNGLLQEVSPLLGPRIPAETLRRFWTMLAHQQSGLLNAAEFARGLGVDGKTIASYLELLIDLLLVRRLEPWHANVGKRLVKSPPVYVRDSGISHMLLGLTTLEDVLAHSVAGQLGRLCH